MYFTNVNTFYPGDAFKNCKFGSLPPYNDEHTFSKFRRKNIKAENIDINMLTMTFILLSKLDMMIKIKEKPI